MSDPHPISDDAIRQLMSRLTDGDGDAPMARQASAHWQDDAGHRARWHGYQLMGDVMRSQDLVSSPQRDADFLARLRSRLALDGVRDVEAPVPENVIVMASRTNPPTSTPASTRAAPRWLVPAAVAAGFVAVAGVLVVTRMSAPAADAAPQLAMQAPSGGLQRAGVGAASQPAGIELMDAAMVRDAQIDRYFRAHRDMRLSPGAALPGGALRSVDTIVPSR